ncbi:MAG: DUF5395 domain-containing protein [Desulfohalobiaceae bacterium]|nr:DUF5395 domain-containing protein [Desulfohalobiaceae bacterium]
MQTLNMSFIHDGTNWIARDTGLEVSGRSLGELDEKLRLAIEKAYSPPQGSRLAVNMDFDYSTIPYWMIQYHPYYIHRRLEFDY